MGEHGKIQAANEAMAGMINAKDSASTAGCYTSDGIILPPGAPPIQGSEAHKAFWQNMIEAGLTDVEITSNEIGLFGDQAIDRGTLTGKLGDQAAVGKYIVWWKKTADGWKIYNDIFNFDT